MLTVDVVLMIASIAFLCGFVIGVFIANFRVRKLNRDKETLYNELELLLKENDRLKCYNTNLEYIMKVTNNARN